MFITDDIKYIGVNDNEIDLFEGQYKLERGVSYNSYLISDESLAVMDSVDARFATEWFSKIDAAACGKSPDYLVVQHMEPDHSSSIAKFAERYPSAKIVSSKKAFDMMLRFFGTAYEERRIVVGEGDTLTLGKHRLRFITAPMVHWPEVIVTHDEYDGTLYSADGFGKFGSLGTDEPWEGEAARYYFGIVGKYGAQVQALLKKASALDIARICPLHGPVLTENLAHYISIYDTWSSYRPEKTGVVVVYSSMYGNTRSAALELAELIGAPVYDLARCDKHEAIAAAFRHSALVLASPTYNGGVFPDMREFIASLAERGYKNRRVGLIENGSWAPMAAKTMRAALEALSGIEICDTVVTVSSAVSDDTHAKISALADEICK